MRVYLRLTLLVILSALVVFSQTTDFLQSGLTFDLFGITLVINIS